MGAFFLFHKKNKFSKDKILRSYDKKGFKNPLIIQLGAYDLFLYKKQMININNYLSIGPNYIFTCGSLFYKGLSYTQSLKMLLSDYLKNIINSQELYGNYVIIFYNSDTKEIVFSIDPAFIKNVYFNPEKAIISTDFLAILDNLTSEYSLNQNAILENLTTGHLISPDTYVNEIQKIDKINVSDLVSLPRFKVKMFIPIINEKVNSQLQAITHANERLSHYFLSAKNLTEEFGANIGLTGGFDSRLLLMHAKKHLNNLITNSFWRPNSQEFNNAKELAKAAKIRFVSFEDNQFKSPNKDKMIDKAFYFFDGQIRSQNNWDEEFNMPDYSNKLSFNHYVGFHGAGGEQYRNADRFIYEIDFDDYVKYEWMFKQCQNVFIDKELENAVFQNIKRKMLRQFDALNNGIGLLQLKKIQNEIWNTANRTTRVNTLNQQQFLFAPFTEYQLSHSAYNFVPFLGNSNAFQINMMKEIDFNLSQVKTNYGYTIAEGEPISNRIIPYLLNVLPKSVYSKIYFRLKQRQIRKFHPDAFYAESNKFFNEIRNKINIEILGKNVILGSGLTSFNFLLNKFQNQNN